MRKTLFLLLTAALTCAIGCAAPKPAPQLVNPVREVTDASDFSELGVSMDAPANAVDTVYTVISNQIAQINFTWDEIAFTYRGAVSQEDISGVYATFDSDETRLDALGVTLRAIDDGAKGRLALWETDGARYTLYTDQETTLDAFQTLCEALHGH